MMDPRVAQSIDHTLLKAEATRDDILKLCEEAIENGFAAVCVASRWVPLAAARLRASTKHRPHLATVVGFPLGNSDSATKSFEARQAIAAGADEIDMVLDIGGLKSRDLNAVQQDVATVVEAAGPVPVKVILETALLTQAEILEAALLAESAGAAYIKTSTGFSSGGARLEDIRLLRSRLRPETKLKASGGIRTLQDTLAFIEAGADRIGTSSGVKIMADLMGSSLPGPPPSPDAY
jgi:deoxyribose-phosphate aldolase